MSEPTPDVVKAIEHDIIFGVVAPNQRLTEDQLMGRFGVSRHHARQALVDLERTGLVVRERNVGAAVRGYPPEAVRQIYAVRELMERQAALMIPQPTPAGLVEALLALNTAFRSAHEAGDWSGVHDTNARFHETLFAACGNTYLLGSIRYYRNQTLPLRAKSLSDPASFQRSAQHHEVMIQLLDGVDRWALAQLCVDHLQPSKQAYLARVAATPAPNAEATTTEPLPERPAPCRSRSRSEAMKRPGAAASSSPKPRPRHP